MIGNTIQNFAIAIFIIISIVVICYRLLKRLNNDTENSNTSNDDTEKQKQHHKIEGTIKFEPSHTTFLLM